MDRDSRENLIDAEDRTTPSTGASDYGDAGAERARAAAKREPRIDREDDEQGQAEVPLAGQRSEPGAAGPPGATPPSPD